MCHTGREGVNSVWRAQHSSSASVMGTANPLQPAQWAAADSQRTHHLRRPRQRKVVAPSLIFGVYQLGARDGLQPAVDVSAGQRYAELRCASLVLLLVHQESSSWMSGGWRCAAVATRRPPVRPQSGRCCKGIVRCERVGTSEPSIVQCLLVVNAAASVRRGSHCGPATPCRAGAYPLCPLSVALRSPRGRAHLQLLATGVQRACRRFWCCNAPISFCGAAPRGDADRCSLPIAAPL
jgi:hypothetical protein